MKFLKFFYLAACLSFSAHGQEMKIFVSFKPIHSLVLSIMQGTQQQPELLIKEDVSPHTFNLKPSHVKEIKEATWVIWVGPSYESHMTGVLTNYKEKLLTLQDSPLLKLLPSRFHSHAHDHDQNLAPDHKHDCGCDHEIDGHFWLSPKKAMILSEIIASFLCEKDPKNTETYQKNLKDLLKKLNELDIKITDILDSVKDKKYIMGHDSLQYLEADYKGPRCIDVIHEGFNQVKGLHSQKILLEKLKAEKIDAVFFEQQDIPASWKNWLEDHKLSYGVLDYLATNQQPSTDLYEWTVLSVIHRLQEALQ